MAGEDSVRIAIDNLRRAVAAKQTQINDIRRQIEHEETNRRQRLQTIENQQRMNAGMVSSAGSNMDSTQSAVLAKQLTDLNSEKSRIEHEHTRLRQVHDQQIHDIEDQWRDLERKINDLQHII